MKNSVSIATSAFLASLLTLGGLELLRDREPASPAASGTAAPEARAEPERDEPAPPPADPRIAELQGRIEELERRLASVDESLDPTRQPVALSARPAPAEAPAALASEEGAREFVLDVVEKDRAAQEEKRAEEQRRWAEDRSARQASSLAERLGLTTGEEQTLAGVLSAEREKRNQLFDRFREEGFDSGARDAMRDEMGRIETWKSEELTAKFGPDLAGKILELDRGRRFEGFGPGGGFGRRGGGNDGGG